MYLVNVIIVGGINVIGLLGRLLGLVVGWGVLRLVLLVVGLLI